jgi:hypothetical protein
MTCGNCSLWWCEEKEKPPIQTIQASCSRIIWNIPKEVGIAMQYQHEPYDAGKHSAHPTLVFMALRLLRQHEIVEAFEEEIP